MSDFCVFYELYVAQKKEKDNYIQLPKVNTVATLILLVFCVCLSVC